MNRREFLTKGLGFVAVGAAGILLPDLAAASDRNFWYRDRWVDIRRAQTGERMKITFFEGGRYVPEAYQKLSYMMRDVVDRGKTASIDFGVFNLMYGIQGWARDAGVANPLITINSGYRTQAHNNNLEGAAKNSLHVKGMAADISVRGLNPEQVGKMASYYEIGGVGFYDGFTHIDTGRVRQWRGGVLMRIEFIVFASILVTVLEFLQTFTKRNRNSTVGKALVFSIIIGLLTFGSLCLVNFIFMEIPGRYIEILHKNHR